jgi:tyrosine-protein phosphatase SIW14
MRWFRVIFSLAIIGIIASGPYYYAMYLKKNLRNFHVVREGVLYRSGQMSLSGLKRTIFENNIKTVITLRFAPHPNDPPPDMAEENLCKELGLRHYRIPYRAWWASVGPAPAEKSVRMFLDIMKDTSNYPVLIHCFAGVHRTGAYCAIYRMEFEHWSNARAMREMRNLGYTDEHVDLLGFLENYRPMCQRPVGEPTLSPDLVRPASRQSHSSP